MTVAFRVIEVAAMLAGLIYVVLNLVALVQRVKRQWLPVLVLLMMPVSAQATLYTVKPSGGSFTTVQGCADTAVAGDICEVYAGTYAGWTQSANGSSGLPITFTAHAGDTVTLTSAAVLTNTNFITVNGFQWSVSTDRAVFANDGSVTTSDLTITNNIVTSVTTNGSECFYIFGDRTLLSGNECSGGGNDFAVLGGTNVVVRNNSFHDVDASSTSQHIDFVQRIGGGTVPALTFSLIENNTMKNCVDLTGNCHVAILRTGASADADTIIIRYNYAQNSNGSGVTLGGAGDSASNDTVYNNTFAEMDKTQGNQTCGSVQNAPNPSFLNNICYEVQTGGNYPFGGTAPPNGGNLVYTVGYSGSWPSPYADESTYAALSNHDPLFANYPTDGTLQSTSPAKNGGVALTTVASGDAGTGVTLKLNNSHFFQPGWAGTQGDWIRIGANTTVQITAINYSTNTATLASSVIRAVGDAVYLYKNSSGSLVPIGTTSFVGAFDVQATQPAPSVSGPFSGRGYMIYVEWASLLLGLSWRFRDSALRGVLAVRVASYLVAYQTVRMAVYIMERKVNARRRVTIWE